MATSASATEAVAAAEARPELAEGTHLQQTHSPGAAFRATLHLPIADRAALPSRTLQQAKSAAAAARRPAPVP